MLTVGLLKATATEREDLRRYVLDHKRSEALILLGDNYDGTWHLDVMGIVFEGESAGACLRALAEILEEV